MLTTDMEETGGGGNHVMRSIKDWNGSITEVEGSLGESKVLLEIQKIHKLESFLPFLSPTSGKM